MSKKSKLSTALLCFFIGNIGIHRFYAGRTTTGIIMLILTCTLVGVIITAPWALVDFILIVTNNFKDKDGNYITE